MRFLRCSTIVVLCCSLIPGLAQKKESPLTRKYPPSQLQEDARVFSKVILALHPAPGIYKPREFYVALLDSFSQSLTDSLTEREFRLQLKLVADELHCGHTEVLYSNAYYRKVRKVQFNYSPYLFIPIQDKVYLLANLNRKKDSTQLKSGGHLHFDPLLGSPRAENVQPR